MMKTKNHDRGYKLLFSEPAMVHDLLTFIFVEGWVKELDFSTLQRLNTEYITGDLRKRESDIVWKVKWKDQWLYLLILIEFQSTIDDFMGVRLLSYVSLMYLDIIKQDAEVRRSKKLPPVLPLVVYTGEKPWDAPVDLSQYFSDNIPELLKKYQPRLEYWLLDEGRCILDESCRPNNLVASLVGLEQCGDASGMSTRIKHLANRLHSSEFDSLREAFCLYIERVLKEEKLISEKDMNELKGELSMLSRNVRIMKENLLAQGRDEGREEGREEGRFEGEFLMIRRLIIKRFGALTPAQERILQSKSADELLQLSERLLDAGSIEEIL